MNYSPSLRETNQLRSLAHQLRDGLVRENVISSRRTPLPQRVGKLLDASRVWTSTHMLEDGNELRARARRDGMGRVYLEDLVLRLQEDRLELRFTRWVKDERQSYCGGSWTYSENLATGEFDCRNLGAKARQFQ